MTTRVGINDTQRDIVHPSPLPFVLVHLACLAVIWSGITWQAVAICIALYWLRIFAIGAGYHRYFSHRSYSTSRLFQFVLAFLAQTSAQKSVLWWAAKHREHHLHSDTPQDVHSPLHKGFAYSHFGWIFAPRDAAADLQKVPDLTRHRELMWLYKFESAPAVTLGALCFLAAGWSGLVVGFFWSTVLVYHATFCINSLAHVHGRKRYVTGDESRNNWLLAIFTMGEGWHNNHHAYQSSVRQGFRWWEIDPTFYILKLLSWCGLVWDLKTPPEAVRRNAHRLGARVIQRAATQLANSFDAESIVKAITTAIAGPHLVTLRQKLAEAEHCTADALANWQLPYLPTRQELVARATAMFAQTPSLEDIVGRAHALILDRIRSQLGGIDPIQSGLA